MPPLPTFLRKKVFFGSNQSGLGCVWTDIAPNYSSSLNSLGTYNAVTALLHVCLYVVYFFVLFVLIKRALVFSISIGTNLIH